MGDWRHRTRLLIGNAGLDALAAAHVAVFGLGGVGGAAVEVLSRAGVGRLTLVDLDEISESNLNRQILATRDVLGHAKVDVAAARIQSINPEAIVDLRRDFFTAKTAQEYLGAMQRPDAVIDAIDGLNSKVFLIHACDALGIPVVTVLGTARRMDPTQVRLTTLDDTLGDPLASRVRRRLRRLGFRDRLHKIPAVISTEPPVETSYGPTEEPSTPEFGRQRPPLPSFPTVPLAAGLVAAYHVLRSLCS